MDVDHEGTITPVLVRLEPDSEPIVISRIDYVDDRITEVWFEVETRDGDRLVLRVERARLRWDLQTVESVAPDRYRGWFQAKAEAEAEAAAQSAQSAQSAPSVPSSVIAPEGAPGEVPSSGVTPGETPRD